MGGEEGDVRVSGTLDASGYKAGEIGGDVKVLGHLVGLYGTGFIDVSGDSGGGTLLFGGDYQGNGTVPNAKETFIGPDTRIFADAVNYGNGGKTIFWADRKMHFQGIVKGRGGKYFGDGGFVEVSGKEELFFDGSVDTSAANYYPPAPWGHQAVKHCLQPLFYRPGVSGLIEMSHETC